MTAVLSLAAGTGVFGYFASRHTESEDAATRARLRGLLAPLTLYTTTGIIYKILSYVCAAGVLVTFVGCYLSWPRFVGANDGFWFAASGVTMFLAGTLNYIASRYRHDTDSDLVHWLKGNHSFWSGLTPTGRKLRVVSLGLFAVAIGFLLLWVAS